MSAERIRELEHIIACHQTAAATAREDIARLQAFVESRGLWDEFRAFGVKQMREWQATASEALAAKMSAAKAQTAVSNSTDLFKALTNFMGVLAAYSHMGPHDSVTLEVGDTVFRAFERVLDETHMGSRRLVPPKPAGDFTIEWNGAAGRVVIRKRAEAKECPGCARPGVMHTCAAQYGKQSTCHHGYWRNCPYCPSQNDERRSVPAPPGTMPKRDTTPVTVTDLPPHIRRHAVTLDTLSPAARAHLVERAGRLFIRHADVFAEQVPPEETKPPARAHLKGCVLDTDHKEGCYVPFVRREAKVREESPGFVQGLQFDPPVSEAQANAAMDALKAAKPHALSPRQALGEALACVERAVSLMGAVTVHLPGTPQRHRAESAHGHLCSARSWLRSIYEDES